MIRDIWIIAPGHYKAGELDDALTAGPYTKRCKVFSFDILDDLTIQLKNSEMHILHIGFQGDWWTWDEIHDILRVTREWEGESHTRKIYWLPHNWFLPQGLVPDTKDPEELYNWMESQ